MMYRNIGLSFPLKRSFLTWSGSVKLRYRMSKIAGKNSLHYIRYHFILLTAETWGGAHRQGESFAQARLQDVIGERGGLAHECDWLASRAMWMDGVINVIDWLLEPPVCSFACKNHIEDKIVLHVYRYIFRWFFFNLQIEKITASAKLGSVLL